MTNEEFIKNISLPGEEWRDVVGWKGLYVVSSLGRIATVRKSRIMKQTPQTFRGKTYMYVCLSAEHFIKKYRVHQLVANAFLKQTSIHDEIDHINNDPTDNRVENLRWCSHHMNMRNPLSREKQRIYKLAHPTHPDTSVFRNNHEDTMKSVIQLSNQHIVAEYRSIGEAALKTGYNKISISAACNKRLKTYRGFEWFFTSNYEPQISNSKNS